MGVNPISSGSPHVRPMGVHRTCGEPDEIKKNTHPKNFTALFRVQGSGGGFSPWTQFPQPAWQASAVQHYFATVPASTLPDQSKAAYNKNGRGTPDVSALGTAYQVINGGKALPGGVGGTSASAPAFAGMIALINDALIAKGSKPLGFLNPFL